MSIKSLVQGLCPPVLWNLAAGLRKPKSPERTGHSGYYRTYEEANRDIPAATWEHLPSESIQTSVQAITSPDNVLAWNERLLAIALAQAWNPNKQLRVIDFGGNFGGHISTFLKIARDASYSWTVIEIPTIVEEGRKRIPPGAPLRYETEIERAPASPDLIVASGALQYLPAPYEMLIRFANVNPRLVFLDRVPFVDGKEDFLTLQHVPGRYFADGQARDVPAWWFARQQFIEKLESTFSIDWIAQNGEHAVVNGLSSVWEGMVVHLKRLVP
jgi:putative methyltransferase (TIGR04325 family)